MMRHGFSNGSFNGRQRAAEPEDRNFLQMSHKAAMKPILIERVLMTPRFNDSPLKEMKTTNATAADTERSKEFDTNVKELSGMFKNLKLSSEAKKVIQKSLTSSLIQDPIVFRKKVSRKTTPMRKPNSTLQTDYSSQSKIKSRSVKRGERTTTSIEGNGVFLQSKPAPRLSTKTTPRKPVRAFGTLRQSPPPKTIQTSCSSENKLLSAASCSGVAIKQENSCKSLKSGSTKKSSLKVGPFAASTLYALSRRSIQDKLIARFRKPVTGKPAAPKELKLLYQTADLPQRDEDTEEAFIARVYQRLMKLNFQLASQYKTS